MRRRRHCPPQSLVEVTCRTFQNRRLLRPTPEVRDLILGILGRAQRRYPIEIHALVFLSTHYHLLVTTPDALLLSRFVGYLNSNVAREIGRLTGWRDHFWGRRYQAILVSSEEAAQVSRLYYLLAQGVKEGLVADPRDWPGVHCAAALLGDKDLRGTWHDRSREYEAKRSRSKSPAKSEFTTQERVVLTPLPCWRHLETPARTARVRELVDAIVESGKVERSGRPVLGAKAVMAQEPASRAPAVEYRPAPWVHAASKAVREQYRAAYRLFDEAFQAAAEALRAGNRLASFPAGSFPPALPWVPHET
ncbi:MAG: transposase [Thermoanaerobaculia bacterium]|nr:transposase [Thermoanaerobaculia bacterium]